MTNKNRLSRISGSLLGGAIGDALGLAIEFDGWKKIQKVYGAQGIREYRLDPKTGLACISDDTQMTMFTANAILLAQANPDRPLADVTELALKDWCQGQYDSPGVKKPRCTWVYQHPAMRAWRAPGNTCLAALGGHAGRMAKPCNNSKGCGGVMRVAPVGLYFEPENREALLKLDLEGAESAAITHGHPLGFIPAAMMTHVISLGVYGNSTLPEAVEDSISAIHELFPEHPQEAEQMETLTRRAMELAQAGGEDEPNIRAIGEGWVAEEALAVALYCCLRYPEDFSAAVIAAVNHSGDSDSTGAIAGNILGAWLGAEAIEPKWLDALEAKDLIQTIADDLAAGCPGENSRYTEEALWNCI